MLEISKVGKIVGWDNDGLLFDVYLLVKVF